MLDNVFMTKIITMDVEKVTEAVAELPPDFFQKMINSIVDFIPNLIFSINILKAESISNFAFSSLGDKNSNVISSDSVLNSLILISNFSVLLRYIVLSLKKAHDSGVGISIIFLSLIPIFLKYIPLNNLSISFITLFLYSLVV